MERFLIALCNTNSLDSVAVIKEWQVFSELNTKYTKMKKPELVEICKTSGFKSKGSKPELIGYIFDKVPEDVTVKKESVTPKPLQTDIISQLMAKVPTIVIRRNTHGNHEHPDTGFVFDPKSKKVIGKQNEDGTVYPITKDDIDTCNKYSFKYDIPESLTSLVVDEVMGAADEELEDELNEHDLMEDDSSEEEIEYDE